MRWYYESSCEFHRLISRARGEWLCSSIEEDNFNRKSTSLWARNITSLRTILHLLWRLFMSFFAWFWYHDNLHRYNSKGYGLKVFSETLRWQRVWFAKKRTDTRSMARYLSNQTSQRTPWVLWASSHNWNLYLLVRDGAELSELSRALNFSLEWAVINWLVTVGRARTGRLKPQLALHAAYRLFSYQMKSHNI